MTRWTTTMRSRPSSRTRTSSPACMVCAGLTFTPLTLTCPARHAPDAADRVLASRTDQIQLSTRPVCSPATHQTVNDRPAPYLKGWRDERRPDHGSGSDLGRSRDFDLAVARAVDRGPSEAAGIRTAASGAV